jgi:LmbE family N-acetylglucosaminyl deacetylase
VTSGRIRAGARAAVEAVAARLARPLPSEDLAAPAVVFAPHQDDETLGCGGLIALKRARGAEVTVVFVTDGRTSHARFLDPDELAGRRRAEAVAACGDLGVPAEQVLFLEFRDGELAANVEAASARIAGLLRERPGRLLLAPYSGDTTADHRATLAAVVGAVGRLAPGGRLTLLEYPVWFWHHWPWVCPPVARRLHRPGVLLAGLAAVGRRLRHLRFVVDVAGTLEDKRRALSRHATQTARPAEHPGWPVLADVAGGQWLAGFFSGREHYRRRRLATGRASR